MGDHEHALSRQSRLAAVITAVGALVVIGSLVFAARVLQRLEKETDRLVARKELLTKEIEQLTTQLEEKKAQVKKIEPLALSGLGVRDPVNAGPGALDRGLSAMEGIERLSGEGLERRKAVTIRYYPKSFEKEVNDGVVLPALSRLGFRLQKGVTEIGDVPTNVVWYGSSVKRDDARLVALTLLSAGLRIKDIRPFKDPAGVKRHVIGIGADASLDGWPALTIERVLGEK